MIKPVFIADIDGTIAHPVNLMALFKPHLHPHFPTAVAQLNKFCEVTGARVALIGARLRITSPKDLARAFRDAGFEGEFVHDYAIPRSWRPFSRSRDLDLYLREEHLLTDAGKVSDAVVIADDRAVAYTPDQREHMVVPDKYVGFNETNRIRALELLSGTASSAWKDYVVANHITMEVPLKPPVNPANVNLSIAPASVNLLPSQHGHSWSARVKMPAATPELYSKGK